ncbi:MazG nucleotide pyrophosphohydrolase domain-containing protein [Phocicoccus pinnipedialis]|uniref:Nucleoside triphosphate pyrophosphohydrolase/pyrophosphatase MazG n=1 Tax=Phocicoccus pinnipedialis TaxID=110845 RepID=A0A6V7R3Q5_9BACL|nr:MazG nucleotide pyrophosphohydrolase domain-containing protein [Jeotgalicoccus pinnipedialis]MBP1940096.1 tetrapyrrole methylase family protein/MazG family protein [Jeotgalicoccus pinnipedialis]CAD2071956.1 Nucleoside triphosphate pyrophosphohydrolase/pyrophosphatase MazG [Jeotgalicoccus pinnipedialis]
MKITIIGLGSSDVDQMSLRIYRALQNSEHLYLRTNDHPAVQMLDDEGIKYESFDHIYEANDTFTDTYQTIADILIEASKDKDIVYAVPGSPLIYETTTEMLLSHAKNSNDLEVEIIGGQSFIDVCIAALEIPVNDGFQILDGSNLRFADFNHHQHTLITQVYDLFSVSNAKLELLEFYPHDTTVYLVDKAGSIDQRIIKAELSEIDHNVPTSNLMTMYVPKVESNALDNRSIHHMNDLFNTLVGEDGCPWDKVQTHESLERYLIEEAFEVIEAIETEDDELLIEELGDILLQVGLHAAIANKDSYFDFYDVLSRLNEKLVHRHPHVFGDVEAETTSDVHQVWNKQKEKEGKEARVKYEKEYADIILPWMKETIHNKRALRDILEGEN